MKLFDAHTHRRTARAESECGNAELSVASVVNSVNEADWNELLNAALGEPSIVPAFGLHPWYVNSASGEWERSLRRCLTALPSTIGEIGLDLSPRRPEPDLQKRFFCSQVELAVELRRPFTVHCVAAWGPLVQILSDLLTSSAAQRRPHFLMHSFSGSREIAEVLLPLGAYFSFGPRIIDHGGPKKRELLSAIPLDRILMESDAANDSADGNSATTLSLANSYSALALLRKIEVADFANRVERNFTTLFGEFVRSRTPVRTT